MSLVLSLFPGGGILDHAFELEGFTVVRGPDPLWGGDVRTFHPPPGRFDGIIGGDPCQSHSSLANLVRAKGLEPSFPDLTGEYQRVVEEARAMWFLRENVPRAPDIWPEGYHVHDFLLCNSTLDSGDGTGNEQMRRRRFWFGVQCLACAFGRDAPCTSVPELRALIDFALFELPDAEPSVTQRADSGRGDVLEKNGKWRQQTVAGDAPSVPVALGGSGKRNVQTVAGNSDALLRYQDGKLVEGANPKRTLEEMLRLQGLPADWLKHQPWTMQAKRKIVGNGVAVPTGRALARAIREVMR